MIRNYLVVALRNFQRQKFFAFLNMFGLALGLASAILIFLYVSDELQYDVMHPYYNDTYRIGTTWSNPNGQTFDNTVAPGYFIRQLKEDRSEVMKAIRIEYIGYPTSLHHKTTDKIILTEQIRWAEPGFDEILDFELVRGNRAKMFDNPNSMIISESGARRLFGDADPMDQVISVKHNFATQGREINVVITGVYRDYPSNSHFKPHYILNINALRAVVENFDIYMEGSRFQGNVSWFESYIVLQPGASVAPVRAALQDYAQHMALSDSATVAAGWKLTAFVTPLSELHFDQKNLWEDSTKGDKKYLTIFSAIALLILLIACINYMNLATARSARRAKEVGLRKSLGSGRREIARQFLYESSLMTIGSLLIALLLVIIFLQPFNQLAHKTFTLASLLDPYMIAIMLVIIVFMAVVSGSYPAFYLSAFRPVEVLKGQAVRGIGAEVFRKSLVAVQYTVSLVLIISTFVVIRQMNHMQNTKLNEQGSQLLSIRYGGTAPDSKFAAFKQAVLEDKDIEHVTMANHLPRLNYFGWIGAEVKFPELTDKSLQWNQLNVEFDFAKTYQLEFVAGRDFDAANLADSSSVILNEAAVKALNQPIEKIMGTSVTEVRFNNNNRTFKVIGVVKDFPFRSMHQSIEPLMLNPHLHFIDKIAYVKLPVGKFQEKIQAIEKKWKEIFPAIGFDYWFVSDEFNRMYLNEGRVASLAKSFAVLAVLITVLGAFGLASYTAEQKTKEVGIRKVLGAEVRQVVAMFVWLFLRIFFMASIVAIPLAYLLAVYWLKDFVYQSALNPLIFILSLVGLLVITLVTVGYEIARAARANPVSSLRRE
ncbi:ABC transporter permease [Fulvivirgaceae bacterium PWU4]|uniref:ABC transporter permease n=1 Tax=Chryseosolibacter histidini TaxID=2782349 RepID=A0AAP2DM87_9BACT|nr:ABC transporter permease [Chryseosolibacter histidini]MBT1698956.1 ABC transporter permease [Chryseosolibacter histidini]